MEGELAERLGRGSAGGAGRAGRRRAPLRAVEVDGRRFDVAVCSWRPTSGSRPSAAAARSGAPAAAPAARAARRVTSPMQGTVLRVEVAEGEAVEAGAVLLIVEAMKMENEILAHTAGVVDGLAVAAGDPVRAGQVLCTVRGLLTEPGKTCFASEDRRLRLA